MLFTYLISFIYVEDANSRWFQVNGKYGQNGHATVSVVRSGRFLVTWGYEHGGDTLQEVHARFFQACPFKSLGSEFIINETMPGKQHYSDVDSNGEDVFVVCWSGGDAAELDKDVYFRILDSGGNFLTPEIMVNQKTPYWQAFPDVAVTPSGNFVITWFSENETATDSDIYMRYYDSLGNPLTNEIRVSQTPCGKRVSSMGLPDVDADSSNRVVITWEKLVGGEEDYQVLARAFTGTGKPVSDEFMVNANTEMNRRPNISMNESGDYIITWTGKAIPGTYDVYFREFKFPATPQSAPKTANQTILNMQYLPVPLLFGDGSFIIAWTGETGIKDGSLFDRIYLRLFDSTGVPAGGEVELSSSKETDYKRPALAGFDINKKGYVVCTFEENDRYNFGGIYGKIFQFPLP